uniref:Stomatin n=1 Tax=Paramormyrops kingsleyae TaxID=1676925 RepID=A0A3B3RX59_9TELE
MIHSNPAPVLTRIDGWIERLSPPPLFGARVSRRAGVGLTARRDVTQSELSAGLEPQILIDKYYIKAMEDNKETRAMRDTQRRERQAALENPDSDIGVCGWLIVMFSILLTVLTLPISIWLVIKIVKEYERAIIFRLGRIMRGGAKGPGLFFILPCTDSFINVDMRTITFDIPPQEVLTKDSVTVSVDGVVYYRVQNATLAVANITNADAATRLLAQTTLRNVLGTKNLAEILSDREEIAHSMQSSLDDATDDWGIKVERVEIKDVKLPLQLQRAMAAEAEATREARAKVRAHGEAHASKRARAARHTGYNHAFKVPHLPIWKSCKRTRSNTHIGETLLFYLVGHLVVILVVMDKSSLLDVALGTPTCERRLPFIGKQKKCPTVTKLYCN